MASFRAASTGAVRSNTESVLGADFDSVPAGLGYAAGMALVILWKVVKANSERSVSRLALYVSLQNQDLKIHAYIHKSFLTRLGF